MTAIKNAQLEKLRTPNYMWVLFESGIGAQSCIQHKKFKFGDYQFKLKRADIPSDIKFENVKISPKESKKRLYAAYAFVWFFAIMFFVVGTYLIQ